MIDCYCVKTGCALVIQGRTLWGDMHFFAKGVFIYNAVLDERGEARCREVDDISTDEPTYYFAHDGNVFERRGVFILSLEHLSWNEALRDYLGLTHLSGAGDGPDVG